MGLTHFIHNELVPKKPEVGLKHDCTFGPCKKLSVTLAYLIINKSINKRCCEVNDSVTICD